ncbi:DUF2167 domain-containing protein [Paenibacillus endoradicis]|uniref:DUF2167 domain-containing protein n=1 Tax=Paenibacillus endoradicis TaxID=2972487 RepID=UPI002158A9A8|nr:DUF2167 domain-containing protein [Paenibacillus endoradicis]MCR8659832.1 DUF2167 domain-containing protein [Paenibacillus endoradicis]
MKFIKFSFSLLICITLFASPVFAMEEEVAPTVNWIEGGITVPVGDISSLNLDESLLYLDEVNTPIIQQYIGNMVYGTELGSVFPASEEENWYVVFDYEDVGYISDKDKSKIKAKELLKSYQQGTEESNKNLPEEDHLFVKGWYTEPYYDETDRTLKWALLAEDFYGNSVINYNIRILTREGYVSVLLVTDPTTLEHDITTLDTLILSQYSINDGYRYEDHDPSTDKISELGLTGLILGGAGLVAAKKAGLLIAAGLLLKKFWFILFAIPIAIWNWLRRRKKEDTDPSIGESPVDPSTSDKTIDHDSR